MGRDTDDGDNGGRPCEQTDTEIQESGQAVRRDAVRRHRLIHRLAVALHLVGSHIRDRMRPSQPRLRIEQKVLLPGQKIVVSTKNFVDTTKRFKTFCCFRHLRWQPSIYALSGILTAHISAGMSPGICFPFGVRK